MPETAVQPLAGDITVVAHLVASNPATVRLWVAKGALPPPFRMVPRGKPMWLIEDVNAALKRAAKQSVQLTGKLAA